MQQKQTRVMRCVRVTQIYGPILFGPGAGRTCILVCSRRESGRGTGPVGVLREGWGRILVVAAAVQIFHAPQARINLPLGPTWIYTNQKADTVKDKHKNRQCRTSK